MSIHTLNCENRPVLASENETTTDSTERNRPNPLDLRVLTVRNNPDSPLSTSPSISRQADDGSISTITTPRLPHSWQRNEHFQSPLAPPGTPSYMSEASQIEESDQKSEGNLYENNLPTRETPSTIARCHSAPPATEFQSRESERFLSLSEIVLHNISAGTRSVT